MDRHGQEDAVRALAGMRKVTRATAEEHGVRIGKWLGDGAMLVGHGQDPVLECALAIRDRLRHVSEPPLRAGVSTGQVVLFEGDDYVGRVVVVAARLCAAAEPWEVLLAEHGGRLEGERQTCRPMNVRGLSRAVAVRHFADAHRST
jgi:adenylate cyclase